MTDYLLDHDKAVFRCPQCHKYGGLWEAVEINDVEDYDEPVIDAWRDIESVTEIEGVRSMTVSRYVDHDYSAGRLIEGRDYREADLFLSGEIGCSGCSWIGVLDDLEYYAPPMVGWDGQRVPAPIPGQLQLEET